MAQCCPRSIGVAPRPEATGIILFYLNTCDELLRCVVGCVEGLGMECDIFDLLISIDLEGDYFWQIRISWNRQLTDVGNSSLTSGEC